jgi:hypothetical protein
MLVGDFCDGGQWTVTSDPLVDAVRGTCDSPRNIHLYMFMHVLVVYIYMCIYYIHICNAC